MTYKITQFGKAAYDRLLKRQSMNYRSALFQDLLSYLGPGLTGKKILEIGPKDGKDTKRLLTLRPRELCLIDLPVREADNKRWLEELESPEIRYFSGNVMYDEFFAEGHFDAIWSTGVLYHNPEQLRMIKRLHDLLVPGGVLVIESATTRERCLRGRNVVQIIYPPSDEYKRKLHISSNVTHLPSKKAVWSWLSMVGFRDIVESTCHRQQSRSLARDRAAYICRKPNAHDPAVGTYYAHTAFPYAIGKSL